MIEFKGVKIDREFLFLILISAFSALVFSLIVGLRDSSIGTDTTTYIDIFEAIKSGGGGKYEPGFVIFVKIVGSVLPEPWFIFFCLSLFITLFYYSSFFQFLSIGFPLREAKIAFFVFASFLLLSSWYLVAVTNGIRQGASLVIVYFSLGLFFKRKYFSSFLFFLLGVSFHYSSILVLPVLFLAVLRNRFVTTIWILVAFGYMLGVNENIVFEFSRVTGIPIYSLVKEYGEGTGKWVGFSWPFFLYTIFWGGLSNIAKGLRLVHRDRWVALRYADATYKVLSLPYFMLGFGAYSNRYAFICWLFLPILQSIIIMSMRVSRVFVFFVFFIVSLLSFVFFVLQIYFLG